MRGGKPGPQTPRCLAGPSGCAPGRPPAYTAAVIRPERPDDADAIHELTVIAFDPMPFSDGTEAPIIRALRAAGELTVSLVDEEDGEVVGHVAFSPVTVGGADVGWYGLGPISVHPGRQRQGIFPLDGLSVEYGPDGYGLAVARLSTAGTVSLGLIVP